MFTIYSIGDSAFLERILNAVAMICGTGDFVQLVSIGMILGIVCICIQAIMNAGRELNLQYILLGWIMYACFFGPAVTVTIEDAYTGQVRVVDNVPLGVGFAGSLISNIGYGVTSLFEQSFQDVSGEPFGEALRHLQATRRNAADSRVLEAINATVAPGATTEVDFAKSLENYIKDCTFVKISLGQMTKEDVHTGNWMDTLPFESDVYGTKLYLGSGVATEQTPTCRAGWQLLTLAINQMENETVNRAVNQALNIKDENGQYPGDLDTLQTSMGMLHVQAVTAQQFVKAAIVDSIYLKAARGYYASMGDISAATMLSQALAQRNTQWAAEESMFKLVVRPMLTFFEGFIFAITPIMGFLFVIGMFGIQLAVRYFQTVIWIQLWMPVIAICNAYVTMAARSQMASLNSSISSFYALNTVDETMETWIATGGMICSMTPIIALFLVTGSTYAFTTLASRLGGGDHINEKITTPDALQPGALHSQSAYQEGNSMTAMRSGMQAMLRTMNFSSMANKNVIDAETRARGAMDDFSRTFTNGLTNTKNFSDKSTFEGAYREQLESSSSQNVSSLYKDAYKIGTEFGLTDSESKQFATSVVTQAGAQGGLTMSKSALGKVISNALGGIDFSISAGQNHAWTDQQQNDFVRKATNALEKGQSRDWSENDSQAINNAMSHAYSVSQGRSYSDGIDKSKSTAATESARSYLQSFDSLTEAKQESKSLALQGTMTSGEFAGFLMGSDNYSNIDSQIGRYMATSLNEADRNSINNRANEIERSGFKVKGHSGAQSSLIAAFGEHLAESGDYKMLAGLVNAATGYTPESDFNTNSGQIDKARGATGSVNKDISNLPDNYVEMKDKAFAADAEGRNKVGANYSANKADAKLSHQAGVDTLRAANWENAISDMTKTLGSGKERIFDQIRESASRAGLPKELGDLATIYRASHYEDKSLLADKPNWRDDYQNAFDNIYEKHYGGLNLSEADYNHGKQELQGLLEKASLSETEEERSGYMLKASHFWNGR